MRAPTVMRGTPHCRGSGRPFCLDTQFAVSAVQRRAGSEAARECKKTINYRFPSSVPEPAGENHLPPCLALQKETVTQQSLYLVLTAVVNISSVAAGRKAPPYVVRLQNIIRIIALLCGRPMVAPTSYADTANCVLMQIGRPLPLRWCAYNAL